MDKENNSTHEEQNPSCKINPEITRRDFIGTVIRFGLLATFGAK